MRGLRKEVCQRAVWTERTEEKFIGMVEDAAVALGGGTGVDAADGLRDGRDDEKPPLGKRLAEERGNVPFVPHPPRQDENEGRSSLQEDVEDFLLQRTLKPAHHAHPFVAHLRRQICNLKSALRPVQ